MQSPCRVSRRDQSQPCLSQHTHALNIPAGQRASVNLIRTAVGHSSDWPAEPRGCTSSKMAHSKQARVIVMRVSRCKVWFSYSCFANHVRTGNARIFPRPSRWS